MDAPANYHALGRLIGSDTFLSPGNVPRWYNQPLGGQFFKHNPVFNWDPQIEGHAYIGK